jgi:DNA primase
MVRDQYLMDVAGRCRLDPERLRPQLEALRRSPGGARPGATVDRPAAAPGRRNGQRRHPEGPALEVLRHAVHNPGDVAPWLRPELFGDPVHQEVLASLARAANPADALASAAPDAADLLARLVVEEPESEPFETVRRLMTEVARAELAELRLRAAGEADPTDALARSAFLGRCIDDLRDADAGVGAADRLLAWLTEKAGDGG